MTVQSRAVEYTIDGVTHVGYLACPETASGPLPTVLVAHTWAGRDAFVAGVARRFAGLGYAGFALDLYGGGRVGSSPEENRAMMTPLVDDRGLLQRRLLAGLAAAQAQAEVDADRTSVVGFCFGGLAALDLARASTELRAAVSFHGLLTPSSAPSQLAKITARVLVLHGWDDPMVRPASVEALGHELTARGADWQIVSYGGTVHGFTNPANNAPERGTVYHARSAARAWAACDALLAECWA